MEKNVRMKTRDTCNSGHFFCVVHMKKGCLIKRSKGSRGAGVVGVLKGNRLVAHRDLCFCMSACLCTLWVCMSAQTIRLDRRERKRGRRLCSEMHAANGTNPAKPGWQHVMYWWKSIQDFYFASVYWYIEIYNSLYFDVAVDGLVTIVQVDACLVTCGSGVWSPPSPPGPSALRHISTQQTHWHHILVNLSLPQRIYATLQL